MTEMKGEGSPYAPNGVEWWKLEKHIGTNRPFGAELRLAAWLWFNADAGDTFTMKQLRVALGDGVVPNDAEQLNRRLRALRPDEWEITSYKDDRSLPPDTYRLQAKGLRIWEVKRTPKNTISQRTKRIVYDRDGSRCQVCGVGDGESYPGEPGTAARLTVGHRIPKERGGSDDIDNLRTECARCNEPMRHEAPDPETFREVLAEVRTLKTEELRSLLHWLQAGERTRSKLDKAYDRARKLSDNERTQMISAVSGILGIKL
jgi:5-methylcytosine-specific restriction endonuclease McrA